MESHDEHAGRHRLTRRAFLRDATVATAVAAMPAAAFGADPAPKPDAGALPMRAIPSTGERLPMVGLGTNAYGVTDPAEIARRRDVVARLVQLGAKVVDTARAYGDSELVVARLLRELNARDRVFLASKTPIDGDLAKPDEIVAETFRRLGTDKVDLLQIHNMHGVAELLPTLRRLKDERRVRYVGATTSRDEQYPELLAAMRAHPLDFIQVDYSIANRNAATEVLPLAQARGMGVLVNMPFGGRREGNLLRKVGERPLPAWASELGATTWAEVLLKYVLSHPAVTCAIPGTTSVANLETNVRASRGALPDASLRKRMEADWDALAI